MPVSLVLFAWLFFCQGTVLSICSSLGLYCASTWMFVSQLAIETTPDFSLGCRKLVIGRGSHFVPGRHPSEPGCSDRPHLRASRCRSAVQQRCSVAERRRPRRATASSRSVPSGSTRRRGSRAQRSPG